MNLQTLHKSLSTDEREALAKSANIAPAYLSQLATGFRKGPSLAVLSRLCAADARLHMADLVAEFIERQGDGVKHAPDCAVVDTTA